MCDVLLSPNSKLCFKNLSAIIILYWDFPGGAVVKTVLPRQGARVQSLVRELDPTCMLQLRVHMPQLRSQ